MKMQAARGGARLAYRELLTGLRRLDVLDAEPPLTPPTAWRIAGHRPMAAGPGGSAAPDGPAVAHEGLAGDVAGRLDVVTGGRRYASDQSRPGMLHGAVLRPPVRGARLRAADTRAAARIPGVIIVREGEFVGAVAPDLVTARRAVAVIEADWDTPAALPGPMADYLRSHPAPGQGWQQPVDHAAGDTEAALAATANTFARESAIDELAHAATCDPLMFRLDRLADDRLAAVLRAAAGSVDGDGLGPRRGLGFAVGREKDGRVATRAEVAVDADGTVRVTRIVTAYECGAVVSPATVISQIQGGTVMALGGALFEQVTLADGHQETRSLAGYRVPRFSDIPQIDVVLVDRPDIPSAGAGETPLIAVAPAIANAIFAATGRRLRALPLLASDGPLRMEDDLAGG